MEHVFAQGRAHRMGLAAGNATRTVGAHGGDSRSVRKAVDIDRRNKTTNAGETEFFGIASKKKR
jgi:hypothetical protein